MVSITELYEKYGFIIFGRCKKILGDSEDARDATQVVFMQLTKHYDTIKDKEKIVPWIFRTAQNYCFNILRYNKKFTYNIDCDTFSSNEFLSDNLKSQEFVHQVLTNLPQPIRDAVYYTYIENLTQEEIYKIIGQSPATIRRNLKKFKDKIPTILKTVGIEL